MRPLRLVPDNTHIRFMRGRLAGPLVSAVLSIASVLLFFWPGLNYGVDFRGGIVAELRTAQPADMAVLRSAFEGLQLGDVKLQGFGSPRDVRVSLGASAATETGQRALRDMVASRFPGTEIRSMESIGARISEELFRHGMEASAAALGAVLLYIWFRFDWQCGVGAVLTIFSVSA